MPRSPRILFKADQDSPIGRGAVLHAAHFRPELARILWAAAVAAEPTWDEILVTEAWRPWDGVDRDLHVEMRAFDFSLNHIRGEESARREAGEAWRRRMIVLLDPDVQMVVHGSGLNLHLHTELDPQ